MNYTNILMFIADEVQIATGLEIVSLNLTQLIPLTFEAPEVGPTVSIPFEAQIGIGIASVLLLALGLGIALYVKRSSNI